MATVLIVDDEHDLAQAWAAILQADDHVVTVACSGAEAADVMKSERFDVVLTDLNMPEGGGMYVSGMARMLQGHRNIIVVSGFLSSSIAGQSRREALAGLGVRKFLSKPVDADELRRAVREAADQEHQTRSDADPSQPPDR